MYISKLNKNLIYVAKTRNYDIFVAKIYDYALIDSFWGFPWFIDSPTSYATLSETKSNLTSLQTRWSLRLLHSLPLVLFERKHKLFTSSRGPFEANLVLFLKNSSILRHIGHLSSSTWWCRHLPSNGQIFHVHQLWQRLSSLSKFIPWFTGLLIVSPLKPAVYGNDLGKSGSPPR